MKHTLIHAVIICTSLLSCKETAKPTQEVAESQLLQEANPSSIPKSWVDNRVEKIKKRLDSSDAGNVVWNALEAMGL